MTSSSGGRSRNSSFEIPRAGGSNSGLRAVSPIYKGLQHMETVHEPQDGVNQKSRVARREFLRLGAIGGAAVAAGAVASTWMPDLRKRGLLSAEGVFDAGSIAWADVLYLESFPTSPLILNPFTDELPIPKALVPEPYSTGRTGERRRGRAMVSRTRCGNQRHSAVVRRGAGDRGRRTPLVYKIELKVDEHAFTTSQVLPIDINGRPTVSFDASGNQVAAGPRTCRRARSTGSTGSSRDR